MSTMPIMQRLGITENVLNDVSNTLHRMAAGEQVTTTVDDLGHQLAEAASWLDNEMPSVAAELAADSGKLLALEHATLQHLYASMATTAHDAARAVRLVRYDEKMNLVQTPERFIKAASVAASRLSAEERAAKVAVDYPHATALLDSAESSARYADEELQFADGQLAAAIEGLRTSNPEAAEEIAARLALRSQAADKAASAHATVEQYTAYANASSGNPFSTYDTLIHYLD